MSERTVLVTGASRGIGAAIAQRFVALDDRVVAWSRSGEAPDGCVRTSSVDVSDATAVEAAAKESIAAHGAFDVAVINAGVTDDGLAVRMSPEQWRGVLSVNLDGAFYTAKAVLSGMIRARRGSIIFMGSISPYYGVPGQANYAAAKAGLVGLARSLAREVASRSITVNVVAPGFIDTDMTAGLGDSLAVALGQVPLGRVGTPDDIAGLVAFLASDDARYLTGAVIPVDGGLAMGL
jgi:3-oxoacyl-[acyl-carrier protein] reductase